MTGRRPSGPGLYCTINLGASRVDDLRATHRDANPLDVVPDQDAELPMRRPRNTGTAPAQIQAMLQAALERRPADWKPKALEQLLADVRGVR